jgi:hypothetical protein
LDALLILLGEPLSGDNELTDKQGKEVEKRIREAQKDKKIAFTCTAGISTERKIT